MRKLKVQAENVEVQVGGWSVYIDNKDLDSIIKDNIDEGTFRAKVTIIIEEVTSELVIKGNKTPEEPVLLEVEEPDYYEEQE